MATATTPPTAPASLKGSTSSPGYDQFVDSRIAKTRTAVKTADVATGLVALVAWALVVLLVSAVADHWIVTGGLDRWERYALWGVGLVGAVLYVATRLGPNLWRSVNPLYAARELERETPELKNSLLNLLQLRGAGESAAIKQTLERQAAERLARAGDAPIDHTPLVRAAKVLLALVAMIGVYVVASPKDFFASAGRVLAPWSQIAAPSRVRITAIEPGAVMLAQGERLNIKAMVSGLKADELVELVYTSDDRQAVGRRVPMTASRSGVQFSGSLPAGSGASSALGLQGSLTYRIEAGDAHSPSYHVNVLTAPMIAPITARYEYPPYTGLKPREVEGTGDLRAIDGTRVTLNVQANLPIESAQIDIGADGRPDVRMTASGDKATGTLALRHTGDGATTTTNYVLRFTSTDGQANHDPSQYQIEVIRDYSPEVSIQEPEAETTDVTPNQRVRVVVEARDPDYALKRVRLVGEAAGQQVLDHDLLKGDGRGRFGAETEVTPQAIGLRPGQVLDFWVEATDNRTPQANVSVSERRQLRVIASDNQRQQGDRRDGEQQPGAGGDPRQDEQQQGENGEGQPGEEQQGGAGRQNPNQPNDGQQGEEQSGADGQQGGEGQQGGQSKSQADDEQNEQGESGDPPPGGLTGPGNKSGGSSSDQSGDGAEGNASSKPKEGANPSAGGSQAGDPNEGQQGNPQRQPGANQNGQSGANQPSGKQPAGDQQSQSPNGDSSQGQGAGENPVARDGSDDGSAFDKMLDWLKQQQQGDKQNGGGKAQQSQGDQAQEGQRSDGKSQQGQSSDQQGGPSQGRDGSNDAGDASPAKGEDGNQPNGAESADTQDAQGEPNGKQGEQGKSSQGSAGGKQQSRNQQGGEQPERGEDGPGAGERDRSGQQSSSQSSQSGGDTPPGESTDRNAGTREGAEGAGQSQAADRGAGQSSDRGAGDSSGREGGEQASDSPTGGQSSNERGAGSKSRESQSGDQGQRGAGDQQPGGQPSGSQQQGGQPKRDPSQQGSSGQSSETGEGQAGQKPGGDSQQSGDAQRRSDEPNSLDDQRGKGARDSRSPVGTGGGPMELADRGATSDDAGEGAESGGDAANLDYARKQTELVLQRLDEQLRKKEVDRKLLDKLGWTEEDLQEFVDRWQSRKQKAAQQGAEGEAALDRALKSLGLSPKGPTAKSNVTDDSFRDLRENARAKTPPPLRDSVEWYLRSINATDDTTSSDE